MRYDHLTGPSFILVASLLVTSASLLGAPGLTTRSKKLLGAPVSFLKENNERQQLSVSVEFHGTFFRADRLISERLRLRQHLESSEKCLSTAWQVPMFLPC